MKRRVTPSHRPVSALSHARSRARATLARGGRGVAALSLLSATLLGTGHGGVQAAPPDAASNATQAAAPAAKPTPTWRFRDADRPVKVVVLAGSIGAWPNASYADRIASMCTQVEIKNLSTVGMGAYALKRRFIEQVLRNWNLRWNDPLLEYWLIFQGGLNSVGMPEATNHHIRELFVKAHRRGFGVVGLSLTPWGDDSDRKRWRGTNGLAYLRHTQRVVDFVLGRLSPAEALGSYTARRDGDPAQFGADELADIRVDLYDSPLRDVDAALRDVEAIRVALSEQRGWQRAHADLDAYGRARALERDAQAAAAIPQWWLREDLRAFDHIHPNGEGHAIIAALVCPTLPESWGCACPTVPEAEGLAGADVTEEAAATSPAFPTSPASPVSETPAAPDFGPLPPPASAHEPSAGGSFGAVPAR